MFIIAFFGQSQIVFGYSKFMQQRMQSVLEENALGRIYTGCHRRNGPNFGRVFLMLNYIDITQNTYIQS